MRCFQHPDREAVGLCRVCSKGVCSECAADEGHGLACRNLHEREAEDLDILVTSNVRAVTLSRQYRFLTPIFYIAIGVLLLTFGLTTEEGARKFILMIGFGLFWFGVALLQIAFKVFRKK